VAVTRPKKKGTSKITKSVKSELKNWVKDIVDEATEVDARIFWKEPVKYLRASSVGEPCIRALSFDMLGYNDPKEARVLRIFRTGDLIEQTNIEMMTNANIIESTQGEVRYDYYSLDEDEELVPVPFIVGHYDAIVKDGYDTKHLVEIKSINERAFGKLPAEHGPMLAGMSPVFNQFPKYIHQWNTYATASEIDQGFLLFEAKNTQRHKYFFLERDQELFEKNIRKCEEAWNHGINEEIAPIPEGFDPFDPEGTCAKNWCDKRPLCKALSKESVKLEEIKLIDSELR
jgi:hypothetical protein